MSEKKGKVARNVRKTNNGETAQVAASRKVEHRETKRENSASDNPIVNRQVTDKPLLYSTLRGKVHDRCTQMPEGKRFQPGVSGNPHGRPPKSVIVQTVKEILAEPDPRTQKTLFERLLKQAATRALQGSFRHLELLFAYGLGRPLQSQLNLNADVPSDEESEREIREALAAIRGENGDKPPVN